ncbi:MAG TPA: ABC transporter ATP-binding protein [Candidatus Woesearchaeota archaeon]|nr:ABC transporter ATP-binding protein [Candidatus Woesearchaeota archaeon]
MRVSNISKSFDGKSVILNTSFNVIPGEIFGIIGLSGAGKTTLLNLMVGFLELDSGDISYLSRDGKLASIRENPDIVKDIAGFSTQHPSFYPKLTAGENLFHFGSLYGLSGIKLIKRVNSLLSKFGLKDAKNVKASDLSGGMQKRLDIACALVHDPPILFLDEPTADLDPSLRKQFWNLIKQINAKGTTIVLASHFLAEIELLCSRIAVLHNKRIARIGRAEELKQIYSRNFEVFLQTASAVYDDLIRFLKKDERFILDGIEKVGDELKIITPTPEPLLFSLAEFLNKNGQTIDVLHVSRPSIGEVFEELTKV